jgi:hypothetical protein
VAVSDGVEGLLVPTAVLDTVEKDFASSGLQDKGRAAAPGSLNSSFGCAPPRHRTWLPRKPLPRAESG